MKKNVIVSLADANYFELLNELVNSIIRFEKSKEVAICILDAGLKENQVDILSKKVDTKKVISTQPILMKCVCIRKKQKRPCLEPMELMTNIKS